MVLTVSGVPWRYLMRDTFYKPQQPQWQRAGHWSRTSTQTFTLKDLDHILSSQNKLSKTTNIKKCSRILLTSFQPFLWLPSRQTVSFFAPQNILEHCRTAMFQCNGGYLSRGEGTMEPRVPPSSAQLWLSEVGAVSVCPDDILMLTE